MSLKKETGTQNYDVHIVQDVACAGGLRDVVVARPDLPSSWVFAGDGRLDFAQKPVDKCSLKVVTSMKCLRMSHIRSYWRFLSLKP